MLFLVAVPIGNLKDITVRALEVLERVEIVFCEDTRNTAKLLKLLRIKNKPKLVSFYDEIEESKIPQVVSMIKEGVDAALVSDAGTPLLSDPGWKLVKRCFELQVPYTAIPGACAAINGIVLSGLPTSRFLFIGFLPKKSGDRIKILEKFKNLELSKIIYESPFRLRRLIEEIYQVYGEKVDIRVVEEMTKLHEKVIDGVQVKNKTKGEVTVIFY